MNELHFSALDDVELDESDFALDPAVQNEINAMEHRSLQNKSMLASLKEEFGITSGIPSGCEFEMRCGYGYSHDVRAPLAYEPLSNK
ncbi:hypothetical protein [Vibrio tritonius]|uniref:hypothetical protein n=1 Tax=Vibrio tritonius TaxID=1435069 RepID=UPI00315D0CE0